MQGKSIDLTLHSVPVWPMSSLFLLDVYGKCLFDETINRRLWVSFSQFKKGSEAFAKILFVAVVDAFFE